MRSISVTVTTPDSGESSYRFDEPVIRVGNLDAVRDFTDVRDMVRAYWLAVTKATPGEVYNIASGVGITIRELLDQLIDLSTAEVIGCNDFPRLEARYQYPNPEMHLPNEKSQMNRFLGDLLINCLEHGHTLDRVYFAAEVL